MPSTLRVRDLIRAIRACKTAQDERDLITKECAYIRTSFKGDDNDARSRDVAKLLYIHMMGYPSHFGQMECLKLIASPRFSDKRVGYLGAMLLLDERQDVHLLVTNSMKNDMHHQVQYVVGIALCALGSICSEGMSRDLSGEVEKLLKSSNPYVVRKAALCAVRIVRKVPDLMEVFVPTTRQLLQEKNHGVLLTGVCLITEMCRVNPDSLQHFRRFIPNLIRMLKNLIMSGYSPEHDVHGISDPFLQVKVLQLMRFLAKGDNDSSESLNDILAQVATNTESGKNVGHAILYESVLTIMEIQSESGLRVLAINILGRFLSNNDKNVRYVALNTLLKSIHIDHNAVQRHRNTILDCLMENDISIRRRALELSFALINENNICSMMKELLSFLDTCETDFKSYITTNVLRVTELYSPSKQWHVDTILSVLIKAGSYVQDDLVSIIIAMVSENTELHTYSVQRLYIALCADISQHTLSKVAVWSIGEFGDLLLSGQTEEDITEDDVLDVLERVLQSSVSLLTTREYAINAIMKLSTRFSRTLPRIKALLSRYSDHLDMELQQRAVEYSAILSKHDKMKAGLLERMPVFKSKSEGEENIPEQQELNKPKISSETQPEPVKSQEASLLDLIGGGGGGGSTGAPPPAEVGGGGALLDLLGLDTSSPSLNAGANPIMGFMTSSNGGGDMTAGLMDLLGGGSGITSNSTSGIPDIVAFDKNGLKVIFSFSCPNPANPTMVAITLKATNSNTSPIHDFIFQAAIPKAFQLQMLSPSGNTIPPNNMGEVTQVMNVNNSQKLSLKMRVRLSYGLNGSMIQDQAEISNFPPELMQH